MDTIKDLCAESEKLEHDCMRLQKYFNEFNGLKSLIDEQLSRAVSESKKKEIESRLETLFPGGLNVINSEVERDTKKIIALFKQLETQLQRLEVPLSADSDKKYKGVKPT